MSREYLQLNVVSLNCWGLPLLSRDRVQRIRAIGETLSKMNLDLIGLQEVYLKSDRLSLIEQLRTSGVENSLYFQSGLFGSGLFILSRYPIVNKDFLKFSVQGNPGDLMRPDYYSGKGLAWVRIETPVGFVDFYNTHLIAPYLEIGENVYFSQRVAQAYEASQFINSTSQEVPVILSGDLNCPPSELAYRTLCQIGGLTDSFVLANPSEPGFTITTDIPYILVHEPERADYLLFRNSRNLGFFLKSSQLVFNNLPANYSGKILAFSDHYGVAANYLLKTSGDFSQSDTSSLASKNEITEAFIDGADKAMKIKKNNINNTSMGIFLSIVLAGLTKTEVITRSKFLKAILLSLIGLLVIFFGVSGFTASVERNEVEAFDDLLQSIKAEQNIK